MIGFALCGSFCTHERALRTLEHLSLYHEILPIISERAYSTDTRFGKSCDFVARVEDICGRKCIHTVEDAEPLGPKIPLDALVVAPCTGNTAAKLAHGISDSSVTMAAKAQLRCGRPILLALATNDALSGNLANIGALLNRKNIYLTPMAQDSPHQKPSSMIADFGLIPEALMHALEGRQLQPLFLPPESVKL